VGAFFLCFAAAIFLSRMFCGRLFDEGRILFLIGGGHLLAAAGMLWLGYAWSPAQFLAAGAVGGLGFGMLLPAAQAAINAIVDANERGAANSTYLISYDLGIGISSLAIGSLLTRVSLAVIYRCSALLIVLSAAMFILMAIPHYNRSRRS
jgi:MFS family permease